MMTERIERATRPRLLILAVLALVFGAGMLAAAPFAAAQSGKQTAAQPKLPPRIEQRILAATPQDIAEGQRIAQASCAGCHGADGISGTPQTPHLAGQRPVYLYMELNAYRTGTRSATAMEGVLKKYLSEDALINLAAFYASLDPPPPSATGAHQPIDPVQAGRKAAGSCAGCHGERGVSKMAGMPSLVGFDPKYFIAATRAYQNGQRKDDTMKAISESLSNEDLNNIALYYALEKPERAQTPAPGDAARGRAAAAPCSSCHGETGVSSSAANPSVAGQDAEYLTLAMKAYKDGSRSDETMRTAMANIDDKTIADIAAFYAAQQPRAPNVRRPLTTEEWAQRCDRCHGLNGNSTDPRMPALAAQRVEYLERVLASYRAHTRKSSEMAAMSDALRESDIKNLAAHYARQRARAVIFINTPGR